MVNTSFIITGVLALTASLPLAFAHGSDGGDLAARDLHVANARRSLEACQHKLKTRHMQKKRNAKRDSFVKRYTEANGISRRATSTTDPFNKVVPLCVLAPEEEIGPYYLSGELIRDDVRESEPGIDMLLDVQVFDVKTCTVLPNIMLDFWSCNSTGVYSGFSAEGTLGKTYLRGLSLSDANGVVQLTTKFPGHYGGRATHLHLVAHLNGVIGSDGTYSSGTIPHIGQIFFPQDIITQVEATSPYNTNNAAITLNSADRVFTQQASVTSGYTDIVTIEKLGSTLADGLLAYISIGLDLTASKSVTSGGGAGGGAPGGP